MSPVIPGLAGALVAGGVLLIALGMTRRPAPPPRPPRSRSRRVTLSRRTLVLLAAGFASLDGGRAASGPCSETRSAAAMASWPQG